MMKKIVISCKSENDTQLLAEKFAQMAKRGDVFALYGTLGAGKVFFLVIL